MKTIAHRFELWQKELEDLRGKVKNEVETLRHCKQEVQAMKQELIDAMGEVKNMSYGKYLRDEHRIILSAPEIVIGNVDRDGVLWNSPGRVVLRSNDISLESTGIDRYSGGSITSRASQIFSIAEDPGRDGTEHVVLPVSEVVTQAKAISLNTEEAEGVFTMPAEASMAGIELRSESGISLDATLSNTHKMDRLKWCADGLKDSIEELESMVKEQKKVVDSKMKELKDLLDFDDMAADVITTRTHFLDIDELYTTFNSTSASVYTSMTEYFASLSTLAEANRQASCIEEMKKEVDKKKSSFKEKSTGTFISMQAERIDALSVDGDGNYRENPEAGVSITARNISMSSTLSDESLQKDGSISLAAQSVDISTINPKVERNDKGEISKGDYPACGDVRIASKNITLESVDYEWKDKKQTEKALTKDGTLSLRMENIDISATDSEGKATGKVQVNAKKVEVKSVDVDKEKRTEKSLSAGSSMLLLSEKMFMGSRDSKTRSKQMQMVSDNTIMLADTTLELQQDKAVVQLSGGNTAVSGGSLDLYGKTTLQSDVTAKGAIKGEDLEVKNMEVKSSFKSPCTSEGVSVPGALASGKLTVKLQEDELQEGNA